MNTPLKVIFAGTPEFAAIHLQALIDSQHEIIAVYSQPDRPAGRGNKLQASAVKQLAVHHNIPVFQPSSLKNTEVQEQLDALNADIMVVVAYGLLLPQAVLNIPKLGCLNVHGSLLPRWRGAAPIQRAIWAGDRETGITIMQMDVGLDTGPMLHKSIVTIDAKETSASLYQKLAECGPQALVTCLDDIHSQQSKVQDNEQANYAKKLSKEEAKIDWQLSAEQLERNSRAFNPWPMSFFEIGELTIKVWECDVVAQTKNEHHQIGEILTVSKQGLLVQTGKDCLLLKKLQLPGKKPMNIADILNGRADLFSVGSLVS
ncbi:methionyl-tRNA formyltransferase [Flavobacterium sp. W21_SRS_FM6]|uniref:methionyl-tRNA formyltransferase n=1 Tax=Flavobacterium sp. W21_SRS_FM6 TaxID=3240268 RepID=UPI003F932B29